MSPELIGPSAAGLLCLIAVICNGAQRTRRERERWRRWWRGQPSRRR